MRNFNFKLNIMMALLLCLSICTVYAVDVSISGAIQAEVSVVTDKPGTEVKDYLNNQEVDLTIDAIVDEKTSIQLYLTANTGGDVSSSERWSGIVFDGITITRVQGDWTWYFLDLVYQGGSFNYYGYDRTSAYSTVMPERFARGVGFDFQGLTVYTGTNDIATPAAKWAYYISYDLDLSGFVIKPMMDVVLASSSADSGIEEERAIDYHIGATSEFNLDLFNLDLIKANLDVGLGKEANLKQYYAVTFGLGLSLSELFSVNFLAHYNTLDSALIDSDAYSYLPENLFAVFTPILSICEGFSIGLNLEYHALNGKNKVYRFAPEAYLLLAENVKIVPRLGFNFGDVDKASGEFSNKYFIALETEMSF